VALEDPGFESLESREIFLFRSSTEVLLGLTRFLLMGSGVKGPGRGLDHPSVLVPRPRMRGVGYPYIPHGTDRDSLTFTCAPCTL
jgi:hypothetical protein